MDCQMVTWPMTQLDPRCCEAVQWAILATSYDLGFLFIVEMIISS